MMSAFKPFSQACENNKLPILEVISQVFTQPTTVWEIGSGTGQHACFFASQLPDLNWQATDRMENLSGIQAWIAEANLANLQPPLALDINDLTWPCQCINALFSANTLHIMSLAEVEILFDRLHQYLIPDALVCCYGPFNYAGQYTSDSNARFDQWLKAQNPLSGIRDFESICQLAACIGLNLLNDHAMPANNRLLVFQKSP
jgi:cyclopropane fatty-acyl-phospholipid synthase-like methyltransferase